MEILLIAAVSLFVLFGGIFVAPWLYNVHVIKKDLAMLQALANGPILATQYPVCLGRDFEFSSHNRRLKRLEQLGLIAKTTILNRKIYSLTATGEIALRNKEIPHSQYPAG